MTAAVQSELQAELDWLYGIQRFGICPGLERVDVLLARLGRPERGFRSVVVGGTNGKGSVSASLAAILQASGQRTGLFTSPHLTHFAERFRVAGEPVPDQSLLAALRTVRPHAEEVEATFFEVVTVLGCLLFAQAEVQWAVMEVGLGGRLDATNVLTPELSIITNVALDHTEVLGETVPLIAGEKAGILRAGHQAVTGVSPELWPLLEQTGADLWALGREFTFTIRQSDLQGTAFELALRDGEAHQLRTPLLGAHGASNAALAAVAALRLGSGWEAVAAGLQQTRWPGRLELLQERGQSWLLDGAHNPAGAAALADTLLSLGLPPVRLVFGVSADKALEELVQVLGPLVSDVILTQAEWSPRAAAPEQLRPLWEAAGVPVRVAYTPAEAVQMAARSQGWPGPDGLMAPTVVCGSLYLIGEVRALLLDQGAERRERWQ